MKIVSKIVSQVEIDILTGETRCLQTDIIYDCGHSLNPAVDLGQVIHTHTYCKVLNVFDIMNIEIKEILKNSL